VEGRVEGTQIHPVDDAVQSILEGAGQ
jgi:hypothetical protein